MTIPAVLEHHKQTALKTGLKKAQSVLSEALQQIIYDTGVIPNITNYPTQTLYKTLKTYFSITKDCGISSNSSCAVQNYTDENGEIKSGITDNYRTYNNASNAYSYFFDDGQLILADGMLLMIENNSAVTLFSIDINGPGTKPDKWGHDLFTFEIDAETGALLPMGHPDSSYTDENTYCSKTSSDNKNGIACTYKALTEKDYFKNLP
ncbi:MAG: hypothetical protein LUE64_03135 [Candidatus Gastranaerophilales bacterium]|nr:hypothetical protein [Candidatus Gastranaerophilales bacterium]